MNDSTNSFEEAKFEEHCAFVSTVAEVRNYSDLFDRDEWVPKLGTPGAVALEFVMRGWNPIPLPLRKKAPIGTDWQHQVITGSKVQRFFGDKPQNIGVQLGSKSSGLTDVDLDCPEAVTIARAVLPKTGAVFGRSSKRDSHYLYNTAIAESLDQGSLPFKDPMNKAMLLEVRIGGGNKGAQTVFPGSVHESGEPIRWEENGEPAQVADDELMRRAKLLAALCLIARYWPAAGGRHDAALTVGGFLARCGIDLPHIKLYAEYIARAANDEDWRDRVRTAQDAATTYDKGDRTRGYPSLKELFGEKVSAKIAEWLDHKEAGAAPPNAWSQTPHSNRSIAQPRSAGMSNDILTEDSAAQQFVDLHGENLRYCHTQGSWFYWNGICWKPDSTGRAFDFARKLARHLSEHQDERKRYITNKTSFSAGVERFSKHDQNVAVTNEYWDRDPWLLGTPGGTVDLRTGKLRPSVPEEGITKTTAVTPADNGCPLWLSFLKEATNGDDELIRFLQQWCGYALTGDTSEHALLFVYGPGGNGKSVYLNTTSHILHDYAAVSAMETFTASANDKHPTDLAMLHGARMVTASETEAGRAWAEARIKQMTGGDRISARFMRQDFFTYMPQFKLTIIGNHKPTLTNVDEAARRRFNIVPFVHKPSTPDRQLPEKLLTEAPGILHWMIEGCLDWQKNGLVRPSCVIEATEEYFSDQEVFPRWLEEQCITGGTISEASSTLYRSWSEYARSVGAKPGTQADFKESMRKAGFAYRKRNNVREFCGVALKPDDGTDA
ncbi:phage/plasmid primase, P4 family [Bradyrhizobium sp. WYCCWR 13022]|uniref:phage/plasmid primase, P4 family n=1 Tax=unclassified Bradyrhizobium TaxID=2631580 RepID=UPI00263B634C|nr:phage/plasmid primase, P4 family [Bradyrhizobium sp. WYCCWR 13022]MDN4982226.1 phage/plasmid primase, P4 family [Bradyrhizobium sp. WYCCWR 13022]